MTTAEWKRDHRGQIGSYCVFQTTAPHGETAVATAAADARN